MENYIGVKLIKAIPMNRLDYNKYRGWELPADENGADEGFLVEYMDGGKSNHPEHEGYISWSPTEVFENAYKKTDGLPFGLAVEAAEKGLKISRSGWNGKGMYLYHVPANSYPPSTKIAKEEFGDSVPYGAYLAMKTAQGNVVPWLASQTDVLAKDWVVIQ